MPTSESIAETAVDKAAGLAIDMAVFDIDGTLISARYPLGGRTIAVLRDLVDSGVRIALASSRQYASLVDIARGIDRPMPLISFNGTLITDAAGAVLRSEVFEPQDALAVALAGFVAENGCIHAYAENAWHAYGEDHRVNREAAGDGVTPDLRAERLDRASLPAACLKIMCDGPSDRLAGVRAAVAADPELVMSWSGTECHDIHLARATKGHAMLALCQHLGVAPQRTAAFGDADSDITMLAYAGHGFAMGQAGKRVRAAADHHLNGPGSNELEILLESWASAR